MYSVVCKWFEPRSNVISTYNHSVVCLLQQRVLEFLLIGSLSARKVNLQ